MSDIPTLPLPTFPATVELRTPRTLLRDWRDSDLDPWIEMNADPEVRRHFPKVNTREDSLGEAVRIRANLARQGWGMWALEIPGVDPFAGFVGLNVPTFAAPWQPAVEVGWRLARTAWQQGFATEAAAVALQFAFEKLALQQVIAISIATNIPSHKVMARLGMSRDATADFVHPSLSTDGQHFLHRISREAWQLSQGLHDDRGHRSPSDFDTRR